VNAIDISLIQTEAAQTFGRAQNLVGITRLARRVPEQSSETAKPPCVVMLTAGMLHHVGPYRLHVDMAQGLAEAGVSSFRFDLSGIGESLPSGYVADSTQRAIDECRQALDFLSEQYGFETFVLFGLCSGADDAIQIALADRRVQGVVMLDGCGFRTTGFHVRRFFKRQLPNLLRKEKVAGKLKSLLGVENSRSEATTLAPGFDIREFSDRNTAQQELQTLVDRGVSMLMIYTGGVHEYFNHQGQFRRMFPNLNDHARITVDYQPEWDHVLYLTEDRIELVKRMREWLSRLTTQA